MNKRISELGKTVIIDDGDLLVLVRNGTTQKITYTDLAANLSEHLNPGWARYDDTVYTSGSRLNITDGVPATLSNNAGNSILDHMHSAINFYNSGSNSLEAENEGDVYLVTVVFKAAVTNSSNTHLDLKMENIGATPYERVAKTITFPKGSGVQHDIHEMIQYYADSDFITNGASLEVTINGANAGIWDIIFFIQRTQKHTV